MNHNRSFLSQLLEVAGLCFAVFLFLTYASKQGWINIPGMPKLALPGAAVTPEAPRSTALPTPQPIAQFTAVPGESVIKGGTLVPTEVNLAASIASLGDLIEYLKPYLRSSYVEGIVPLAWGDAMDAAEMGKGYRAAFGAVDITDSYRVRRAIVQGTIWIGTQTDWFYDKSNVDYETSPDGTQITVNFKHIPVCVVMLGSPISQNGKLGLILYTTQKPAQFARVIGDIYGFDWEEDSIDNALIDATTGKVVTQLVNDPQLPVNFELGLQQALRIGGPGMPGGLIGDQVAKSISDKLLQGGIPFSKLPKIVINYHIDWRPWPWYMCLSGADVPLPSGVQPQPVLPPSSELTPVTP